MSYTATAIAVKWFDDGTEKNTVPIYSIYGFYAGYNPVDGNRVARIQFTIEKPTSQLAITWIAQTGSGGTIALNYAVRRELDETLNNAKSTTAGDGTLKTGASSGTTYTITLSTKPLPAGTYYLYIWTTTDTETNWIGVRCNSYYPVTITYEILQGSVNVGDRKGIVKIWDGSEWRVGLMKVWDGSQWRIGG